jgi:hypothetical protein
MLFDQLDCEVEFESFLSCHFAQLWPEVRDLVGMVLGYQFAVRCPGLFERNFRRQALIGIANFVCRQTGRVFKSVCIHIIAYTRLLSVFLRHCQEKEYTIKHWSIR